MEVILPGQTGLVPIHVVKGTAFATERVLILLRLMAVKTASENHSRSRTVLGHHAQVRTQPLLSYSFSMRYRNCAYEVTVLFNLLLKALLVLRLEPVRNREKSHCFEVAH